MVVGVIHSLQSVGGRDEEQGVGVSLSECSRSGHGYLTQCPPPGGRNALDGSVLVGGGDGRCGAPVGDLETSQLVAGGDGEGARCEPFAAGPVNCT